jgi:hypothetical protein
MEIWLTITACLSQARQCIEQDHVYPEELAIHAARIQSMNNALALTAESYHGPRSPSILHRPKMEEEFQTFGRILYWYAIHHQLVAWPTDLDPLLLLVPSCKMQVPRKAYHCLKTEWLTASSPSLSRLLSDALLLFLEKKTSEDGKLALGHKLLDWAHALGDQTIVDEISDVEISLQLEGRAGAEHCHTYIVGRFTIGTRMVLFDAFGRGFNCLNAFMKMNEFFTSDIHEWLTYNSSTKDAEDVLKLLQEPDVSTPERAMTYSALQEWIAGADVSKLRVFHFLVSGRQGTLGNPINVSWRPDVSDDILNSGNFETLANALEPEFHTCFNRIDLTPWPKSLRISSFKEHLDNVCVTSWNDTYTIS